MPSFPRFTSPAHVVLIVLCSLFFVAGILRLNDFSLYNPDSTRYVIWGHSLAQGHGYVDDTQPEPDKFVVHAPLYSLLIAPVEALFPYSLVAIKIWTLLWGITVLVLFYGWLRKLLGKIPAIAGVVLLAFNPLMLVYGTEALSEVPFLMFIVLIMYLCERIIEAPAGSKSFPLLLLLVGLSSLLREIGIALVLASVIFFVFRKQPKRALLLLLCSALFIGAWYVRNQLLVGPTPGSQQGNLSVMTQRFVTPSSSSLLYELSMRGWLQFKEYAFQLGGMILYPQFGTEQISIIVGTSSLFDGLRNFFDTARFIVCLFLAPLLFYGVISDINKTSTGVLRLLFTLCYLAVILLYPIHDIRFLFPLLPMVIYYVLFGSKRVIHNIKHELSAKQQIGIVAAVIFLQLPNVIGIQQIVQTNLAFQRSPVQFYQSLANVRDYPPVFGQPWHLLGEWIRAHVPGDAVIASPAKDIATMIGQRKILELDPGIPRPEFEKILRDNGVSYIITSSRWENMLTYEFALNETERFWFEPVYSVSNLRLFKLHSSFLEPLPSMIGHPRTYDTLSAGGLLRKGRVTLLDGAYDQAAVALARALQLAPFQPEVVYQNLVIKAFRGDTAGALAQFQRLLTLTQAGSYSYNARTQMQALQILRDAMLSRSSEVRDLKLFDAATTYWNLGYRRRASEIMNGLLESGSNYFFGLLWGFHFARQQNDTVRAHAFFKRLVEIDSGNAVVKVFGHCIAIDDSIRRAESSSIKSQYHLTLAHLYDPIELHEEAIDEAERAVGLDSSNVNARLYLGELFLQKAKPKTALVYYLQVLNRDPQNVVAVSRRDSLQRK